MCCCPVAATCPKGKTESRPRSRRWFSHPAIAKWPVLLLVLFLGSIGLGAFFAHEIKSEDDATVLLRSQSSTSRRRESALFGNDDAAIPSPALIPPLQLTDLQVGYKYVEFPDDVFYMESIALNRHYQSGTVAYVPVQRFVNGMEESHLYTITPNSTVATHVAGPIAAPDGNTDVTIFGSTLSSAGILYLCAWNRNSILVCDIDALSPGTVAKLVCAIEIEGTTAPNDVALQQDDNVLYVAGGTPAWFGRKQFSNAAVGQIYKVELDTDNRVSVVAGGFNTLAGIEVVRDSLIVAQLFDIFMTSRKENDGPTTTLWEGLDENDQVWLADNIDVFNNEALICPAFSTTSAANAENILKRSVLSSLVNLLGQLVTKFLRGESLQEALQDPEVSLLFSNTFIEEGVDPDPVRLIFLKNQAVHHFEIDLVDTRQQNAPREILSRDNRVKGMRHYFNDQVTHAAHLGDYIACVNFEQPRVLLLEDQIFLDAIQ